MNALLRRDPGLLLHHRAELLGALCDALGATSDRVVLEALGVAVRGRVGGRGGGGSCEHVAPPLLLVCEAPASRLPWRAGLSGIARRELCCGDAGGAVVLPGARRRAAAAGACAARAAHFCAASSPKPLPSSPSPLARVQRRGGLVHISIRLMRLPSGSLLNTFVPLWVGRAKQNVAEIMRPHLLPNVPQPKKVAIKLFGLTPLSENGLKKWAG